MQVPIFFIFFSDTVWNEADKVMPDFRERKEWLRKNGAGLDV
jgi:hypothetical protein